MSLDDLVISAMKDSQERTKKRCLVDYREKTDAELNAIMTRNRGIIQAMPLCLCAIKK